MGGPQVRFLDLLRRRYYELLILDCWFIPDPLKFVLARERTVETPAHVRSGIGKQGHGGAIGQYGEGSPIY